MQTYQYTVSKLVVCVVLLLWSCSPCYAVGNKQTPSRTHMWKVAVTQDDAILRVACTIYAEAKGESLAGKRAVAGVIYERAGDRMLRYRESWERSCIRVIQTPYAFSCWNGGWPRSPDMRRPAERQAWYESYRLAQQVVRRVFVPDIKSHFYHEASIRPYWSKGMTLLCQIDNHKFYK